MTAVFYAKTRVQLPISIIFQFRFIYDTTAYRAFSQMILHLAFFFLNVFVYHTSFQNSGTLFHKSRTNYEFQGHVKDYCSWLWTYQVNSLTFEIWSILMVMGYFSSSNNIRKHSRTFCIKYRENKYNTYIFKYSLEC